MRGLVWVVLLLGCNPREDTQPAPAPPPRPPPQPQAPVKRAPDVAIGDVPIDKGKPTCDPAKGCKNLETCAAEGVELIYLVDWDNNFYSFDPRKLPGDPFHKIGPLCSTRERPYSMAIDRRGIAWVLYGGSLVHRASIVDGKCTGAGDRLDGIVEMRGMGFAVDDPKTDAETLYLAEGLDGGVGTLDLSQRPLAYARVGVFSVDHTVNPELTGTGDGKLFAFFPNERFITEIDRKTGKLVGPRRNVPGKGFGIGGYAFAHYAGVFYVFATLDGNSAVWAINRKTGKSELVRENLPMQFVGAGVSTCAPLLERVP